MGTLRELWQSTENLYRRFDLKPSSEATRRKFNEEVLEFQTEHILQEVSIVTRACDQELSDDEILTEEAVDVIVTLIGMLMSAGISYADFEQAAFWKRIKNDNKTHETHVVHNGLIERRSKFDGTE
jgi:hypothetical protein